MLAPYRLEEKEIMHIPPLLQKVYIGRICHCLDMLMSLQAYSYEINENSFCLLSTQFFI